MIARTLAFALLATLAAPALAQTTPQPTLRADVTVSSELVRLGDLVDNAGTAAAEPVFRAPDLGGTGTIQAGRVLAAARAKGLATVDVNGLAEISVTRASRRLDLDEIRQAIAGAIARRNGLGDAADLAVTLDPGIAAAHIEPTATGGLEVAQLSWSPVNGRFDATLTVAGSPLLTRTPLRIRGQGIETLAVPVYARAVNRGEVLHTADVVVERLPRSQAASGAVEAPAEAIGQALRRSVRPGQPVQANDLTKPNIIARNDAVTLTYEVPGMVLTIRAKALDTGAEGDAIPVLNGQSNRIVQATITGPGRVSAVTRARLALN